MGGIERVTETLARFLIKNGFEVVFLSVEHTCSESYECIATQYFTRNSDNEKWILEIINQHKIGTIINQMGFFNYCPKTCLPSNVKVVTVMHDSYYAMYPRLKMSFLRKWHWKRVISKSLRNTYEQSDKIVLFFPSYRDEYRFFYSYANDDKFSIIPNFNSYSNTIVKDKKNTILWVGRHSEWHKRTKDILIVWKMLEDRFPDWNLEVLGDGPDGNGVREIYKKLKLKRCSLHGVQDPTPFYENASIICLTSSFESFGMVITEGMQHGCVPVAFDSYSGVRHIIHNGEDGLLIQPFNLEEYAERLSFLMDNKNERDRLSYNAVESVKRFDAKNVIPKWVSLLEDLSNN